MEGTIIETQANGIRFISITINGTDYSFSEQQLEAAKVVDKFDWKMFALMCENEYSRLCNGTPYVMGLMQTEYLQARCLSLWNERAFKDNEGIKTYWSNRHSEKWYPYFRVTENVIQISDTHYLRSFIGEHHLDGNKRQQAIDYFGDAFMRTLLGVK